MAAAKKAEDFKRNKYKLLTHENGAKFSTAAVETTGGLGKEFRDLIDFVSLVAQEERWGWEPNEIINGMKCAAAVAIQIGNARLIIESRNRIAKRHLYNIRQDRVAWTKAVAAA
jgi:hypothetical protein